MKRCANMENIARRADQSRRHDLNAERERCWNMYHGYWSGADHRWHDQRDWDDHH